MQISAMITLFGTAEVNKFMNANLLFFFAGVKEGYMDFKQPQHIRKTYKWTTSYFVLM